MEDQSRDKKKKPPLESPGDDFTEIEAAHDWQVGGLHKWYQIHPGYRAKMVAFYLHKGQREAFMAEQGMSKKGDDGYEKMMAAMH